MINLKLHISAHRGQLPHICPHCSKRYSSLNELEKHIKVHTSKFRCPNCNMKFEDAGPSNENDHAVSTTVKGGQKTSIQRDRICPNCNESVHKMIKNMTKRFHPCSHCSEVFSRLSDLKKHVDDHKQIECSKPHCGKKFFRVSELETHMLSHTGGNPPPCGSPHTCQQCGKVFFFFF